MSALDEAIKHANFTLCYRASKQELVHALEQLLAAAKAPATACKPNRVDDCIDGHGGALCDRCFAAVVRRDVKPEKPPAPALPRYTRVIHTTAGDTWQTSEDGILWRDTPRVHFGDGAIDAARSPR